MKLIIKDFFKKHFDKFPKKVLVTVSGGLDSMALLFLLKDFCDEFGVEIFAVTVDHKMRENSSFEAKEVAKIMEKHKINHKILEIDENKLPKRNIEANLRKERYALIYKFCLENEIFDVFVGHQKNDVAENFLIRIFRGSQIDGISPMKEVFEFKKVKIHRPILSLKKQDLEQFLQKKKIRYFEDETNFDEKFLRNKIRKFFNNFEEKNLIIDRISKFGKILQEIKEFEDEILLEKANEILIFVKNGGFLIDFEKYKNLKSENIFLRKTSYSRNFGEKIALKILSLILTEISQKSYKPRLEKLKNFEKNIFELKKGKKVNFYNCFAKILTKNNLSKIKELFDEENLSKVQNNPENYILIYAEKAKTEDFYFTTILKKIYENN